MGKLSLQSEFNKFREWYPWLSDKAILKEMEEHGIFNMLINNGAITQADIKKLKSGTGIFLVENSAVNLNENRDTFVSADSVIPQENSVKKECMKRYHPKFNILEVDSKGNIIPEQFSIDAIKRRYPETKYTIEVRHVFITVINKQTKNIVFDCYYSKENNSYSVRIYNDNGKNTNEGMITNNKIHYWYTYTRDNKIAYGESYGDSSESQYGKSEKSIIKTDLRGNTTITTYDIKTNKILEQHVECNDGSTKFIHYENGKIIREWFSDKDGKDIYNIEYRDGKPYIKNDEINNTRQNYLVEDIVSKIGKSDILGNRCTPKSIIRDIKTRLGTDNVFTVWQNYYETTGNDLFDDIDKTSLTKKEKDDLKNHLAKTLSNMTTFYAGEDVAEVLQKDIKKISGGNLKYHVKAFFNDKNESIYFLADIFNAYKELTGNELSDDIRNEIGLLEERKSLALTVDKAFCCKRSFNNDADKVSKYLADRISDDISGPGSGSLKEHIMMLNPDNVIGVLKYYPRPQILGIDVTKIFEFLHIDRSDYDDWADVEPLICAIYNEWGLDDITKKRLVEHIINCVKKCHSSKYTELNVEAQYSDIANDLIRNKNDSDKIKKDAQRLDNRIESSYDNIMKMERPSYPNGKIDEKFCQNTTGDCWLLAGLISIIRKPAGKKMIENLLTVNNEKREVTVFLKGVNQKYVISFDEITSSNHLVLGDGDIRAIEIAMDRYLKQEAYRGNVKDFYGNIRDEIVDINGNWFPTVFNALFGNYDIENIENITKEDINSSDKAYSIGFGRYKYESHVYKNAAYDVNGKPMDIIRGHEYGIMKADDKYVWLLNPWNPTPKRPIRIKWEKLKELNITIGHTNFNA